MADQNNYAPPFQHYAYQPNQLNVSQPTFPFPPQNQQYAQTAAYPYQMQMPMQAQTYAQYPYAMAYPQPQAPNAVPMAGYPYATHGQMAPNSFNSQREENFEGSKEKIPVRHDNRYNLTEILYNNILQSDYFKVIVSLPALSDVITEIKNKVVHLEPTALGHALLPSNAFCLLYKLFMMGLTQSQVHALLKDQSCHVRGIAFLYLRYLLSPDHVWDWFREYLHDETLFVPGGDGKLKKKVGTFVEDLLVEQKYYRTIFPRIPVPILRDIKKKLLVRGMELEKGRGGGDEPKRGKRRRKAEIDKKAEEIVKQRDKEDASAVGRNYSNRPVSYKSCLSVPMQIMTTRERSPTPPTRPRREARDERDKGRRRGRRSRSRERKAKKPPSKAHLRKMEELKKIYGDASVKK